MLINGHLYRALTLCYEQLSSPVLRSDTITAATELLVTFVLNCSIA